ncbi:MAG: 50S ribosomal protein L22 [Nitrospirae bacterium CG_4_9_14_3_um_filter_53_35]|nr:MAG: 50S ribosomal protein L22 [Nitrospirae bacterium CG2_30_53_67]PIS37648.1 MAG: 50S ribosomal protein L22 [Nitrospirae bacterium CG08_land_8_20_14_0_20_52_24]PIV82608.1 MAG: 50S ribosomal protein L22 [Nitrospirae bacterium CG17_big_fil_post_rev_8_21_14_2_50_50_9]PIW86023.1 MAG: 50S ribosomal protein L22 [Nitrospirae bacterium CG_4_8_14_3_um_filter_50_41]PIX86873.1 MAG: 50S ribosomal protein L22 [Nitrospirae bacterium CG_4_10_14_3_um_filter_53_41]PJA76376.1 MAG: 50S ribosomal protein L22 
MEVKAVARFVRISPRKVRLVVDAIRGHRVEEAIGLLRSIPHRAAPVVEKLLQSAVANAEQKEMKDVDRLRIRYAVVDPGPTIKRFLPRAMGRATPIRKRTSHITIVVSE